MRQGGPAIGKQGRGHRSNDLRHGNLAGEMVVHAHTVTTITAVHGWAVGVSTGMSGCPGCDSCGGVSLSGRRRLLHDGPPERSGRARMRENSEARRARSDRRPPQRVTTLSSGADDGAPPTGRRARAKSPLSANGFQSSPTSTGHHRFRTLRFPATVDQPAGCDVSLIY
jgi:hypothetical protein